MNGLYSREFSSHTIPTQRASKVVSGSRDLDVDQVAASKDEAHAAAKATANKVYRFGEYEVDVASRELRRRGLRVKLQEHPFKILEALLEAPGQVVTREALYGRLWGQDVYVDFDGGINAAVRKLRRALGDSAKYPRFVETRPRVGYRFLASVEVRSVQATDRRPLSIRPKTGVAIFAATTAGLVLAGWILRSLQNW